MVTKTSKTTKTINLTLNVPNSQLKRALKLGIDIATNYMELAASDASELRDDYNNGVFPAATCEQANLIEQLADLTAQADAVAKQLAKTTKRGYKGALVVDYAERVA